MPSRRADSPSVEPLLISSIQRRHIFNKVALSARFCCRGPVSLLSLPTPNHNSNKRAHLRMKVRVRLTDSKLRVHFLDVDDSASILHIKSLLATLLSIPAGFAPILVHQKQIVSDERCVRSINYLPANTITLVFAKILHGSSSSEPAAWKFHASVEEVVKALLHDVFLLVQPTLTRAVRAIFVIRFGESEWLAQYKKYLGPSMQDFAVDDGRAFDLCVSSACACDVIAFCS
jgi:hypothetical protein